MNRTYKIGEIFQLEEDCKIKTLLGKEKTINKGTKCIVIKEGMVLILTGISQNNIVNFNLDVKGIDYEGISQTILRRLDLELNIRDILYEEGITSVRDILDSIEKVLKEETNIDMEKLGTIATRIIEDINSKFKLNDILVKYDIEISDFKCWILDTLETIF